MNHLWPCRRKVPSPAGSARVVLVRRSEPPWFSVMPMPMSAPVFSARDEALSYSRAKIRGSHSLAISGACRSVGTEP